MKYFALLLLLLALGGAGYWSSQRNIPVVPTTESVGETEPTSAIPAASVVVQDLEIPWDIAFLLEGDMLVTERTGHVIAISAAGAKTEIPIEGITKKGEGGLLGIVLHPDFKTNHFLYLYMSSPGTSGETQNRVVRYRYEAGELHDEKVIIGGIPADNPFGTPVWSYGHRNPQGLAWDSDGRLWETEHGPTGEQGLCCRDEVNLIEKGGNYGWPAIVGDEEKSGMQTPARSSGEDTWAPASLVYLGGSLFFGGLRGEALYEAVLDGERIVEFKEHFKGVYGRIRTVRVGPDDMLYITTSNRDDRGTSKPGDDKIIRIDPTAL